MTINLSDNSPRISYTVASGVTQSSFTVPFEFFEEGDLNAYVDGTLKTITTDYTVAGGSGSTGSIAMTVVGASGGSTVVITRSIPLERTTDFPTSGPFDVSSLNEELDRITAINADLNDEVNRSLRLTDADAAANLTLPTVASRAGKVLAFDLTTGDLVNGPSTAGVTTVAAAAADIATLADIEDGTVATDAISDTASIKTDITTVAGIASNVTTTAGNTTNINTVAGNTSNINTVAGINSDVTTVSGISANVTTAAGISADITTVATYASNVTTVASDIAAVVTAANDLNEAVSEIDVVASNISNVNTVGTNIANVNAVAAIDSNVTSVSSIVSDVTTAANNNANITTVAGISGDVTTVANISSDVTIASGDSADIQALAAITSDVSTAAAAITEITDFNDRFNVGASAPSAPTEGDLWYDTVNSALKVYVSGSFQTAGAYLQGLTTTHVFTATAAQTTFTTDDASNTMSIFANGNTLVFLNGIRLVEGTSSTNDYYITGNSIELNSGAAAGDVLYVEVFTKVSTTQEASLNQLVTDAQTAEANASTSETNAAASAASASADATSTAADVVTTNSDVVLTNADVVSSAASAAAASTSASNAATSETNAAASASQAAASAGGGTLKITSNDTTADVLGNKLVAGDGITATTNNAGGNETLSLSLSFSESNATATAAQTAFTVSYTVGLIQVFMNGVKLISGSDFTASNGTSVTLASGAAAGDVLEFVVFG